MLGIISVMSATLWALTLVLQHWKSEVPGLREKLVDTLINSGDGLLVYYHI